nr:uncharacterized protein LOC126056577 [Helicoverpa armigera]
MKHQSMQLRASTASTKLLSPGPSFSIEKGVKQGDPLSPNLFTCTLEEVFQKLSVPWTSKGIVIGNKRLTNLRFADDIVLFASTSAELQDMLQDLSRASREVGLQMNMSKTHTMTNSTKRREEGDGQALHYVDEYIYLGQLVSFDNRQEKEIDRRIENAWKSYWSMKQTGVADVGRKAATLKWNWAGQVSRMHPERWATIVTQWTPQDGHRRRDEYAKQDLKNRVESALKVGLARM